ncbi:MAG: FHA domain-containing protein [Magnetococcales bacterium]|nr:FHA domain-containing protein [Magnetococcales bacterium]
MTTLIDETGRFDFKLLQEFATNSSADEFLAAIPHAVLVGSGLYRGWFDNKVDMKKNSRHMETVLFLQSPEQKNEVARLKMLEKHVYPLFGKVTPSNSKKNKISIGRASSNDIILLDQSISSKHAEFYVGEGKTKKLNVFSIKDLGSSNFTIVNGKRLAKFWEKELNYADVISFGRFSLVLVKPKDLYKKLKDG